MRRRALLAALPAVATLSGCLVGDETQSTGPDANTRFEDADVPPLSDQETHWYHESPDIDVWLAPDDELGELPRATLGFTLHNERDQRIEDDIFRNRVFKYENDAWYTVKGMERTAGVSHGNIDPDSTQEYTLEIDNERPEKRYANQFRMENHEPLYGPGLYAYRPYVYGLDGSVAALFELEGDELELVWSERVESVEQNDDIVHVTFDVHDDTQPNRRGQVTVEPTRDAERTLIREQLTTTPILQSVGRAVEAKQADHVVLDVHERDWTHLEAQFQLRDETQTTFEFDGRPYEVTYVPGEDGT